MKFVYILFNLFLICNFSFATDYSKQENWAALPTVNDNADWTPSGLFNQQDSAKVDVFFIHPTTDVTGFKGNANINDKAVNKKTDNASIKYQASVFNGSCKVYAPRYRQAVLNNFFTNNDEQAQQAFDTAYSDIKAAFEYYLQHYNNGRPIIIAGHSQGSMHAQHLLRDFFDGKPLQKKLVEAYIVGFPIAENQFRYLKVSEQADTFGGYISYSTFGENSKIKTVVQKYDNAVSVNPLSWTTDQLFVSGIENKGVLNPKTGKIIQSNFGTRNNNGILEIQKPNVNGIQPMMLKNYHIFDYALFYINIRENVALRIKRYLEYNQ